MVKWLVVSFGTAGSLLRSRRRLALENLALRQQLAVLKRRQPRPRLSNSDRVFWVLLSRFWRRWREALHIVRPETVVGWHRQGFRLYWRWKSRRRGRPRLDPEIRALIRQMCRANPLWGAPRIHGELLKLGIEVSEATVSKYMGRRSGPPSQTWKTFLENHLTTTIGVDFFTVPTATFRVLFVFVVLSHHRRELLHFNVTAHPTAAWTARQLLEACGPDERPRFVVRDRDSIYGEAFSRQVVALGIDEAPTSPRSPWQNPYAERVIGSIRRECLDHVIILEERHLRKVLTECVSYYNSTRTHLALGKNAPAGRPVHFPQEGKVVARGRVGGLHHEYMRAAA